MMAVTRSSQLQDRDFESFRQSSQRNLQDNPCLDRELANLELQKRHLDINLAIAQSPDLTSVTAWDTHRDECCRIDDLATTALAPNGPNTPSNSGVSHQMHFSSGFRVILTLFYVAFMCRDPLVRRRDMRLMADAGI